MSVIVTAIGYVGLLFFIAWSGDRDGTAVPRGLAARARLFAEPGGLLHVLDLLRLGRPGLARGLDFLPIYIGPILVVGFGRRLVERIANLARDQNLTTVADFVSARYGKSQPVAALAALIALMASGPYIALQLKAITQTILMVIGSFEHGG